MIVVDKALVIGLLCITQTVGQCIERSVQDQVVNTLRWNAFWFGTPQPRPIGESGVLIKSTKRTSVLVVPTGLWIMFVPSPVDAHRRILVRSGSRDLIREESEYRRYVAGGNQPGEAAEQVTAQCRFTLKGIPSGVPASQRGARDDPKYLTATFKFVSEQLRYAQCPCRFWAPYVDSSDPMGFALVENRNKDRYFLGFYWEGSTEEFSSASGPAETPAYAPSNPLTRRLERSILKASRLTGIYP